jgi:2Fe-2S ferredoxin
VEGEDSLTEMQDNEDDRMDMAFDVRPESRLGCHARLVGTEDIVVQISDESIKAWYDEHPNERKASGYQGGR